MTACVFFSHADPANVSALMLCLADATVFAFYDAYAARHCPACVLRRSKRESCA